MKYFLIILVSLTLLNCTNNYKILPEKTITVTTCEFINDTSQIIAILKETQPARKSKIDYQDFVDKLLRLTFLNNSNKDIYLLKPLHLDTLEMDFKNFTNSIHLLQVSDDSIKWQNIFYRQPVDTYDDNYDTIKPKSKITRFAYIDNNKKSKYLKILLEYRSDSSLFKDTIPIISIN